MIVEGYTMDLYCDTTLEHGFERGQAQYAGATRGDCTRQARRAGWILKRNGLVVCPDCNPRKTRKNGQEGEQDE